MSKENDPFRVTSLDQALAILRPNVLRCFDLYRVNHPSESAVLPGALCTNADELRALAFLIEEVQRLDSLIIQG